MPSKHFTILHSNDLHGDFLAESQDDKGQVGGLALLSGYINQVRREVPNTL
ncbi:MAG: bifunctional metallophosphatase/5'-nucleotidase, partial [Chloroflexi bacterium]|nr:bifunctional metallophosphatase/5'-nucleotidase [Chloroflexota bacterium]